MNIVKKGAVIAVLAGAGWLAWSLFYPEKSRETKESIEAIGSVTVDRVLSSMEHYAGKTEVALEHYKQERNARRRALISLMGMKADWERKASEALTAGDKARQDLYAEQATKLVAAVGEAETRYRESCDNYRGKKMELGFLKEKTTMLRNELAAMGGGETAAALEKARSLEEEIKSACSRIEAELQVQQLDNENRE